MNDYDVVDYIPVIGDIYRYGKLGYKIGSWIAKDEDSYNNRILSQMVDCINYIGTSDEIFEIYNKSIEAANLFHNFDFDKCKKYQATFALYLVARIFHVWGLCECIMYSHNLKELQKVKKNFIEARNYCSKVREIEKTIFTSKRELIDEVRVMADEKKTEIKESLSMWRKQYRTLYKTTHPIRWYLGMWIFI